MIKFKFEDKTINFPESWDEVTVNMFTTPDFLGGDSLGMLSALSGIDKTALANTTEDLDKYLVKAIKFLRTNPSGWKGGIRPDAITVLDVECKIPKEIELKMYGQKVMYGAAISRESNPLLAMAEGVAIYIAPMIYPDDWYEKIGEVAEAVGELPITKIYPIADFFLSNTKK